MQLNSVNGQHNANKVELKKAEKQQTETKLQQQQSNKTNSSETQTLQDLLERLNEEVATAETETTEKSGKKGSKPSGPPPEILAELNKYGLSPTGSKEGDEAAIAQAKQKQSSQQKSV